MGNQGDFRVLDGYIKTLSLPPASFLVTLRPDIIFGQRIL